MVAADAKSQPLGLSAALVFLLLSLAITLPLGVMLYTFGLHENHDGLMIVVQLSSWALLTGFLVRFYRSDPRQAYALTTSPPSWLLLGTGLGLTMGWFPSWLVTKLDEHLQNISLGQLEALEEIFSSGAPSQRIWLFVAVVIAAPVCEELIFRGFLWRCLQSTLGPLWTLFVTSLLFAAYHVDPLHIIGVLPIGVVLGILRLGSKSIAPGILAHLLNNLVGAALASGLFFDEQTATSTAVALSSALVTLTLIGLAWWWHKRKM